MAEVGKRVRELRGSQRLSLRQLAERMERVTGVRVSHSWIGFVEQGKREKIDVAMLSALAVALGVPVGEITGEMGAAGSAVYREYDGELLVRVVSRLSVDGRLMVEDFARLVEMRERAQLRYQVPTRVLPEVDMEMSSGTGQKATG